MIFTKAFWAGLGERAIKTFFQAGVAATVTAGISAGVSGVENVNWISVGSIAVLATILSVATSIGNADFTAGSPTATGITPVTNNYVGPAAAPVEIDPTPSTGDAQHVAQPDV